jgi:hypothetical protein
MDYESTALPLSYEPFNGTIYNNPQTLSTKISRPACKSLWKYPLLKSILAVTFYHVFNSPM